mmetsp:Transcript_2788/g.6629  ORF Transcript_2788/g.6629 Transcript_2788/m.6629 type:complete len:356 (-) Transcript_2788:1046-2113(-)
MVGCVAGLRMPIRDVRRHLWNPGAGDHPTLLQQLRQGIGPNAWCSLRCCSAPLVHVGGGFAGWSIPSFRILAPVGPRSLGLRMRGLPACAGKSATRLLLSPRGGSGSRSPARGLRRPLPRRSHRRGAGALPPSLFGALAQELLTDSHQGPDLLSEVCVHHRLRAQVSWAAGALLALFDRNLLHCCQLLSPSRSVPSSSGLFFPRPSLSTLSATCVLLAFTPSAFPGVIGIVAVHSLADLSSFGTVAPSSTCSASLGPLLPTFQNCAKPIWTISMVLGACQPWNWRIATLSSAETIVVLIPPCPLVPFSRLKGCILTKAVALHLPSSPSTSHFTIPWACSAVSCAQLSIASCAGRG